METATNNRNDWPATDETVAFDPFYVEFKHTEHLPPWLKLQHAIRAELEKLMAETHRGELPDDFADTLLPINNRIAAYNKQVPNVYLRKPKLTAGNWAEQYEEWI